VAAFISVDKKSGMNSVVKVIVTTSFFVLSLCSMMPRSANAVSTPIGICYLNGASGLDAVFRQEVPNYFARNYGIQFTPIDIGRRGDVATRAERFLAFVDRKLAKDPTFQCHLMAFSMGGVVARYSFARLKLAQSSWASVFPSLTTFASPHLGTPVADLMGDFFPDLRGRGLETLSERAMEPINNPQSREYWKMPPGIRSFSYRSFMRSEQDAASFAHKIIYEFIFKDSEQRHLDPRNDGMVPLRSQSFGIRLADFKVPHSFFSYDAFLLPFYPLSTVDLFKMHWDCLETGYSSWLPKFQALTYFENHSAMASFCQDDVKVGAF